MIREYNKNDIDAINKLLNTFEYSYDDLNKEFLNIIVYEDNDIKGILVYELMYDRVEIDYIIVEEEYRRNGIASKLVKKLFELSIDNITLEVRESNKPAINFYLKNGFEQIAVRKNYYKDESGILMMKKLGE